MLRDLILGLAVVFALGSFAALFASAGAIASPILGLAVVALLLIASAVLPILIDLKEDEIPISLRRAGAFIRRGAPFEVSVLLVVGSGALLAALTGPEVSGFAVLAAVGAFVLALVASVFTNTFGYVMED